MRYITIFRAAYSAYYNYIFFVNQLYLVYCINILYYNICLSNDTTTPVVYACQIINGL